MLKRYKLPVVMMLTVLGGCQNLEPRHYHDDSIDCEEAGVLTNPPALVYDVELPEKIKSHQQKISLVLTQGASLADVFQELSRQTDVGIVVGSQKRLMASYSVKDKAVIDVVEDLCHLSGLRYQVRGEQIHIEEDTPYTHTYELPFLNTSRSNENQMSITTDVFSVMDKGRGRVDNGSSSQLNTKASSEFWEELKGNLDILLDYERQGSYSFHQQAGLVTVKGTARQHGVVEEYFKKLKQSMGTQVLIEARIIEVRLDDKYQSGINWSVLGNNLTLSSAMGALSSPGPLNLSTGLKRDVFTLAVEKKDFSSVLNFVKKHGTVQTISNPRMTVMNNQPAMLKVATNEVFFQLEFDRYFQADGKPDVENFSSNIMTVPIGLVLVVQPSVDLQSGEITMTLRPTVSRIDKFVEDPAVAIKSNQRVASLIPVVQVREIDSVLKMRSGEVIILGGLMEERSRNSRSGIPVLDDLPIIGSLTRGQNEEQKMTELVLFLTARIVE